jgi:ribosomal protein L11 methyltransferase
MDRATHAAEFDCIAARAPDRATAERALAEALAAGSVGAEERDLGSGITLLVYAPVRESDGVAAALARVVGAQAVTAPERVEPVDWSEAWKAGLRPIEVSERLRIRTSFESTRARPGQREIVIDPGQAFGTGGHESTRLALAWIDALRGELAESPAILDVGTGTGVLALAALALGAWRAVGCDLDPLATAAARANARANGLSAQLDLFTGSLAALAPGAHFSGIAANLLARELDPLLDALAAHLRPGAWLALSGLLESELDGFEARGARAGLACEGVRRERDASGTEWGSLLMRAPRRAGG